MAIRREPENRPGKLQPSKYEAQQEKAREENYNGEPTTYEREFRLQGMAESLAKEIGNYLNYGGDEMMLAQELSRKEHRTLQQKFMKVCMAFIADEAMLGGANYYDLRNQATCALAQHIMDSLGDDADSAQHLPFI